MRGNVSIKVSGRTYAGSYAVQGDWLEVTSEHGSQRAKLHSMPVSPPDWQAYVEGLARTVLGELVMKR